MVFKTLPRTPLLSVPRYFKTRFPQKYCAENKMLEHRKNGNPKTPGNPGSLTSAQYICMTGWCSIPRGQREPKGPRGIQREREPLPGSPGSPRGPKGTHGDRRETIKERAETHRGPKGNHGNDITSNGNALNINWERHSFTFSIIE